MNRERKLAFVLAATDQSTMIVNRFDYHNHIKGDTNATYGLGYQIFEKSAFDAFEIEFLKKVLHLKADSVQEAIYAIDCGANIGVHTVNLAKYMTGWGFIIGIEAQERVYYALAGNVALNNCFNAKVFNCAVSDKQGTINIPVLDHTVPASFGSLELLPSNRTENIGQHIAYDRTVPIQTVNIDALDLPKIHFIKIDIEGMEILALEGAKESLRNHKPVLFMEHIKCGYDNIVNLLKDYDYVCYNLHANALCIHKDHPLEVNKLLEKEININWAAV